ncbi:Hypothetical predicted protein [Paramuricea clavata]|uniref:Uncharacterized protein n=1 Tax=Paramuricea clavata TaxID=317549 RepID=A0A6S7G225_PARCT|nr:Hypothetical predicted protein [Paramuricea clavata]
MLKDNASNIKAYTRNIFKTAQAAVSHVELYIPEIDPVTTDVHHDRGDHNHIYKRIASSTRNGNCEALDYAAYGDVLHDPKSGLTHVPLVGERKQSFADSEWLLSYHVVDSLQRLGYKTEAKCVKRMDENLPFHYFTLNGRYKQEYPSFDEWGRIVDKSTSDDPEVGPDEESDESVISLNTYPTFKEFCCFLTTEARIACHPVTSQQSLKSEETSNLDKKKWILKSGGIGARSFAIGSNEEQRGRQTNKQVDEQDIVKSKPRCSYCKEEHELDTCVKFLEISIPNRQAFIISKRLCWGCLKWGHSNHSCQRKKNCHTCGEVHPTALHRDKPYQGKPYGNLKLKEVPKPNEEVNSQENTTSNCIEVLDMKATGEPVSHSLIVPVWVHHSNDTSRKILTYALLDDQSDACFIKDSALKALGINGPEVELKLSTVLAQKKIKSRKITGLVVRGVNKTVDIALPRTYSRDIIPA